MRGLVSVALGLNSVGKPVNLFLGTMIGFLWFGEDGYGMVG